MQDRYLRHLALPDFGPEQQKKLAESSVLVVGAGGLGSPALLYLAAAGIGTIGIADPDVVSLSNLQRQVLFREADLGESKVEKAAEQISLLNSEIRVKTHFLRLNAENVEATLSDYELVIDGTDNFPTRYLLNDACVLFGKTYIYGSIYQYEGQVAVFNALRTDKSRGPNYRDLFPAPPPPEAVPDCAEGGVLGILPGIIGTLQASEAIKVLAGIGEPLDGKLWILDAADMTSRKMTISARPETAINKLIDYQLFCGHQPLKDSQNLRVKQLKNWMQTSRPHRLIDVRTAEEYQENHLESENIPLDTLDKHIQAFKKSPQDIVFYCQTGMRSKRALELLYKHNLKKGFYHLEGGIEAWQSYSESD
ncbi:MAG: molybdenum cofactor biosynthesis protein MoeB [Bacteroidetes bacterium]|nr:molybdenum cofactor biosynthesis protein MoeB [Bacteroidota bacterium]